MNRTSRDEIQKIVTDQMRTLIFMLLGGKLKEG
jgi:hypothetical protein